MAIKKEQQQKTLANRIGVNRGSGFDAAITSSRRTEDTIGNTLNNLSDTAANYLSKANTLEGKTIAQQQEFGSKTIAYEDESGKVHNMEMVVPVSIPSFQSNATQAAYEAENLILYNNAVKASLHGIVDTAANDSLVVGATMEDYQTLVENQTAVYINELPDNYKQTARNHVNTRLALKAPAVHAHNLKVSMLESEQNITKLDGTLSAKSFEAAIMNNEEQFLATEVELEELSLLINNSNHYQTDAHKQDAQDKIRSEFTLNKKISSLFGNSLAHDPSDENSGNLQQTTKNLTALHTLLTNPSIREVTIDLDETGSKQKVIKRSELRNSIPEEDWYGLSDEIAKKIKPLITASTANSAIIKKTNQIRRDMLGGVPQQKDAEIIFNSRELIGIWEKEFTQTYKGKTAEEVPLEFERWIFEEKRIIRDMPFRKVKRFLQNPVESNIDETTQTYIEFLHGVAPDSVRQTMELSESEIGTLNAYIDYRSDGMSAEQAVTKIAKEYTLRTDPVKGPVGLNDRLKTLDLGDIEDKQKLDTYISGRMTDYNDVFGPFGADDDVIIGMEVKNYIQRQVYEQLEKGEVSKDKINTLIQRRMTEIKNGTHPRFGYSQSTLPNHIGLGNDLLEEALVADRAEGVYAAQDGTVDYILPFIKENASKYRSIAEGGVDIGEDFPSSNVRLTISHRGRNPTYRVSYVENNNNVTLRSIEEGNFEITYDDFQRERKLYSDYLKIGDDETFAEWRKKHV